MCKNRSLQRRTGRSLEIKLQIGRKSICTGSIRNIYSSIILLCAGILELLYVVPKIVRCIKNDGK